MTLDRVFLAYMALCGAIIAVIFVIAPPSRDFIPAYFWVLIPMAAFEGLAFFRNRGSSTSGAVITVWTRLIGFAIAIALILVIPYLAGQPVVQLI